MLRTGSLGLDIILGGGWKPGTLNEIWGGPGSGKTTLAEHTVLELPTGKQAMWMCLGTEVPHRPSGALVCQPRNAEQAFWIMDTCVLGNIDLIIVDSANGLVRQRELDGDPDYVPHPQREYKDELTRLRDYCRASGSVVIFLSQPRDKERQPIRGTGISEKVKDRVYLKILREHQDGSREIKAGIKDVEPVVLGIDPGTGIDWSTELVHLALDYGVAERRASWIECYHERYQGTASFSMAIEENPHLAIALDEEIRHKAGI